MALKPDVSALGANESPASSADSTLAEAEAEAEADFGSTAGNGGAGSGPTAQERKCGTKSNKGPVAGDACDNDLDMLPTSLTPLHYDIRLHPDLLSGQLCGSVAIDAVATSSFRTITLHAKTIDIQLATVYVDGVVLASIEAHNVHYNEEMETAQLCLPSEVLLPSTCSQLNVQLIISFAGRISDSMYGLYRSKTRNRHGQPAHMLVTQFQAKCARMAFPCWDEPAIKAEFTLTLTVPSEFTALSNMPVTHSVDHGKLKTVYFRRSPRMSTYLLAIVAGELDYIEAISYSGPKTDSGDARQPVPCRIYTPPADIDKVQFSLDTAVRVLEMLANMFNYEYPLPKLDLVAVPELEAGGMENWGLVLFRTVRLFITKQTSLWIRQKAVYVISHELSHQWFGNLVTMAWWDDLWLNEGFATWIGIYITDKLYPEWKRWDHFVIEDRQAALSADSLRSSHPIQVTIKGSADIDQVFDSITYYKGCSLIRMLSAHLGIDIFMAGVRAYLYKHAYSTATTKDLWQSLETASAIDVGRMMHSWTAHVGYPVLTVDDSLDDCQLQLRQNRYLNSGKPTQEEDQTVWWIPLGLVTSDTPAAHEILHQRTGTIEIPQNARWFKLNHRNAGLYRVCYSRTALKRLSLAIRTKELCTVDIVGILNDMVALVTSGYLRTSTMLDMVSSFAAAAESYVVWQILGYFLESLLLTWADHSDQLHLQVRELARSLFAPKAAALGWTHAANEDPLVARLRAIAIPRAAWAGDSAVISHACELFTEFYLNPDIKPFHHDFTASVFEIAVRHGSDINYERIREMYESSQRWHLSEDHRMAALGAMACTKSEDLMKQTLEYALSDHVLPQDLNIVIGFMVSSHPHSKYVVWQWFCANYQQVVDRLGECSALLGHVVGSVIGEFANESMAQEIEQWFGSKRTAAFDRTIPQSLEFIRVRNAWYQRDKDDAALWFSKYR
ncbi:Aminopeptidase 2 mitochondrial [Coemansia sp. RSA 989]|nr:Aminopeptidase 2 mitochondrial [Coemansia sp. RSA 989]KAJ1868785.1 Aminopeptidase 2 mitochondrial [Coemansia sp. RSA 990]